MKNSYSRITTHQHEKFLAESRQLSSLLEMRRDMDMLIESACNTMPLAEQKHAKRLYLEWKNIGYMLNEAQLTPEQISQIFHSAEEQMSATGANRTVVGKVADVGSSIASGLARVRDVISSTGPVSGFDVGFDTIQGKLLSAAGGEAGAVGKALQKYKEIGEKYPVTQKVIYTGLIMLSGLSAAGAGGIAIVAGIKTLDGLLKGKKFSTAVMDSLPGAALSWIMQHLPSNTVPEVRAAEPPAGVAPEPGDSYDIPPITPPGGVPPEPSDSYEVPPGPQVGSTTGGGEIAPEPDLKDYVIKRGDTLSGIAQKNNMSVDDIMKVNPQITNPNDLADGEHINIPTATGAKTYAGGVGTASDTAGKVASGVYTPSRYGIKEAAYTLTVLPYNQLVDVNRTAQAIKENASWEYHPTYVHLSHAGVENVFENSAGLQNYLLEAGFFSGLGNLVGKGAKAVAGGLEKAGKFAGKVGHSMANKVTADKLMMNWKVANKPTDSKELAKFLQSQGINDTIIKAIYKKMGIPGVRVSAKKTTTDPGKKQKIEPTLAPKSSKQQPAGLKTSMDVLQYLKDTPELKSETIKAIDKILEKL
jgi:LysM repeat protein